MKTEVPGDVLFPSSNEFESKIKDWARIIVPEWIVRVVPDPTMGHRAECFANAHYKEVLVKYNPDIGRVDELVAIHELVHCLTDTIYKFSVDHVEGKLFLTFDKMIETLTEDVARALYRAKHDE